MTNKQKSDVWCWDCDGSGQRLLPEQGKYRIRWKWHVCQSCHGTGRRARRPAPGGLAASDAAQAELDLD